MQRGLPVEIDHGSIEFFVDDPTKKSVVFPYTSQIDQISGDPTYQTPALLATAKVLFGKKPVDTTALGTKISNAQARIARESAMSIGEVTLRHE
jgi:hypothetical protein